MYLFETILNFVIGVTGLGIIILIHELGHLIMAQCFNIDVEVFSLGFGPKLFRYKGKKVHYCLSLIPLGGYCKMRGSDTLLALMQQKDGVTEKDLEGTFYRATPWKRILVLLAGPFANILFAFVLFALIHTIGMPLQSYSNKVVLASDFEPTQHAADLAGIHTGDTIHAVDNIPVDNFYELGSTIQKKANIPISLHVARGTERLTLHAIPKTAEGTGEGRIGVFPWIEPIIASITAGSSADAAGLKEGDQILRINTAEIAHALEVSSYLEPFKNSSVEIEYKREDTLYTTILYYAGDDRLGIQYTSLTYIDRAPSLLFAITGSLIEIRELIRLSILGIRSIFSGTPLSEVIAGPIQISYLVGATSQSSEGFSTRVLRYLNLISIISIAIAFMNLLPIPITDGGQILIPTYELIRRKPLSLRTQYYYQFAGFLLMVLILLIAFWGDISFLRGGIR